MAVEIILPRVDMDMETGKFTRWFVNEGERAIQGKPLFEIETDKAAMEVDAPVSGVLRGVSAKVGDQLPVGTVIGWLCEPGEILEAPATVAIAPARSAPAALATAREPAREAGAASDGKRATPMARRLARERGLSLRAIPGSGPLGRVQASDVERASPSPPSPAAPHREWLARGSGAPIVFVHGFGADLNGWRPLIGYFPAGVGLLALDLPGHGGTPLGEDASLDGLVESIAAALAAEGLTDVHLVGHSLGGAACATLSARLGRAPRSLTLLAPAGLGPDINQAFVEGFLSASGEASLTPWLHMLAVDEARLGSAMVKSTLRQRAQTDLVASQSRIAAKLFPDGVQALDARGALGSYAGPTKIIFGREDRIIPAKHAEILPGAVAAHVFAGVGHMPHFEARADVARLILDNFAAGEARAVRA